MLTRTALERAILLAAALTTLGIRQTRAELPAKMNVLVIAVDDLNTRLGCYGDRVAKTPHIDRLAARGVRFDRAYCQYPLCNPSRTSLLSGYRPETTRIFNNQTPPRTTLGEEVVFLPEAFRQQGYFTARVGKIAHNIYEDAMKWDVSEDPRGLQGEDLHRQAYVDDRISPGKPGAYPIEGKATGRIDAEEPDGRTAVRIVELLAEHKDRPFFIAAGFYRPHEPFVCPKKYFDLYPPDSIQLPNEPADHMRQVPPIAYLRVPGDAKMTDAQKRQGVAAYHACTSFIDAQVGVVLDALDRLKLTDRTVVVFFGDHGFLLGEHGGLWRKAHLFEEATHVPLIIAAPGKRTMVSSPRLAELVDLYPTLCEICGLPAPKDVEGISLVPLLDSPDRPWKKAAFCALVRGQQPKAPVVGRSLTTERYRYTEWGNQKAAELYDLENDPHEYVNLVNDPRYADELAEMRKLLSGGWKLAVPERMKSSH